MRVAIFTSALDEVGGWGRYSVNLARSLMKQGVEVTIFTEDKMVPFNLNVEIVHLNSRPSSGIKNVFYILSDWYRLRNKIKNYDVVHAFTETHLFLAWLLGKPFVVSTHGTYTLRFFKKPIFKWFAQKAFSTAASVIITSEFTFQKISPYVRVRRTKQLPNGVDMDFFKRDISIEREPNTIITVGGIKTRKAQDLVSIALAQLKGKFPNSKYIVVGDSSSYKTVLDELIERYNLEKDVIFAGTPNDEELVRLYNKSGVFVLASRVDSTDSFEGYPLSLLEASATKMPIIGSYGCGAEHLIEPGKNGYLVHQNAVDELVDYLSKLFSNKIESEAMGQRAYDIAKHYSWDVNAKEVSLIYDSIKNEK